jgi:hypothetical protein
MKDFINIIHFLFFRRSKREKKMNYIYEVFLLYLSFYYIYT